MAFTQTIKDRAYLRAGGKCERCGKDCIRLRTNYGFEYPESEFHHILSVQAGGYDGISNCEHLCVACHHNTKSYGGY